MNTGIYKITNVQNGKIYLGQSKNIRHRFLQHLSALKLNKHDNTHLQNAFNKYGVSSFMFEVLLNCEESDLRSHEKDLIYLAESYKPHIGYNKTMGGDGCQMTQEVRDKISKAHKGRKHTEAFRRMRSVSAKGNKNSVGRKVSEETREKQSAAKRGKPSQNKGKKASEATREKQRISQRLRHKRRLEGDIQ